MIHGPHDPATGPDLSHVAPAVPHGASGRVRAALERAADDARRCAADPLAFVAAAASPAGDEETIAPPPRTRRVAIGDPQAPLPTFLEILDRNDLLGADGRLHPEVLLVSMGDHFDWGPAEERARGAESAYRLLAWLGAHGDDQVILLAGNHDLARVGELATIDDASFEEAHVEATALRAIPFNEPGRHARRRAFLARHPMLPSVGVAARDWAHFQARQRPLVGALFQAERFRAAYAPAPDLLLVHGGVTPEDLDALGFPAEALADAVVIAEVLQELFEDAVDTWSDGTALDLEPLYRIGNADRGESRGIFVQRPADPEFGEPAYFAGPPRRRFDPRGLAPGLAQVTGHIRDQKCRELMPRWADPGPAQDGPLRHLWTDGERVRYAIGLPGDELRAAQAAGEAALMYFADGGMNHAAPARYELFDLDTRRAVSGAAHHG